MGMVWLSSSPSGARVYVDGTYYGKTPLQSVGIPAGNRHFVGAKDGYQNWSGYVRVKPGVFNYIPRVTLKPQ